MQFFRLFAAVADQQDARQVAASESHDLPEPQLLDESQLAQVSGGAGGTRAPGSGW